MAIPDAIIKALRSVLSGDESPEELMRIVRTVPDLPEEDVPLILEQLQPGRTDDGIEPPAFEPPRLLVDWGDWPRVGHQARPQFVFVCPPCYRGRPRVKIVVDRELDHDLVDDDVNERMQCEEEGLWSLHVPFRLTTGDRDCRPGQYLIEVFLGFDVAPPRVPRFFHSQIRLTVPSADEGAARELVIDGDGQSIVNLHGHDLKSFGRVVLRGGDDGIINLQSSLLDSPDASSDSMASETEELTREYQFKLDQVRQRLVPEMLDSSRFSRPGETTRAMLKVGDNRRIMLIAQRQVTFGRSRDCDVVLRFLPRNDDNDSHSRNISRKHFSLILTEGGLALRDLESRTGIEIDYEPVRAERLLTVDDASDALPVGVGTELEVEQPLQLSLGISHAAENRVNLTGIVGEDHHYFELLGERAGRLWRLAEQSQVDGCRIRRTNNLVDQEEYVLCYRHVLIGSSSHCLIRLSDPLVEPVHARLMFIGQCYWLENLAGAESLILNGAPLPPYRLVPIQPGMNLSIGNTNLSWENNQQLHL